MKKSGIQHSIFRRIMLPLVVLIVFESLFSVIFIKTVGVIDELKSNGRSIIDKQVENRRDYIEHYMVGVWSDLSSFADYINDRTENLIDKGRISVKNLDDSSFSCEPILDSIYDRLLVEFRTRRVSGMYIIFNTEDISESSLDEIDDTFYLAGLYIRDFDIESSPSFKNDDLVLSVSPSSFAQRNHIALDAEWSPVFEMEKASLKDLGSFFYMPYQYASDKRYGSDARFYGYWSMAAVVGKNGEHTVSYSMPLMLKDGTVYGVLGIDVAYDYFCNMINPSELDRSGSGVYLVSVTDGDDNIEGRYLPYVYNMDETYVDSMLKNGYSMQNELIVDKLNRNGYNTKIMGKDTYVSVRPLNLYSTNSPFEKKQWMLMGGVEVGSLYKFEDHLSLMFKVFISVMLVIGIAASFFIAYGVTKPVIGLSKELHNTDGSAMPKLSMTGIKEFDQLSVAVMDYSKQAYESNLKVVEKIEHERDYDVLTGLMNRRAFYRTMEELMNDRDKLRIAALVMLDLDNLKYANDIYGHEWGDKYIKHAAKVFSTEVPEGSICSRISGDEFYIFIYGYGSKEEVRNHIENLYNAINNSTFVLPDGKNTGLKASAGVSWYPDDSLSLNGLMKKSDFAMYQVKTSTKGGISEFDKESYEKKQSSLSKKSDDLDDIIYRRDMITYNFQPIVDAVTGEIYAYEAFMRVSLPSLHNPIEVLRFAAKERRLHEIEKLTWSRALYCYKELMTDEDDVPYLFINSIASQYLRDDEKKELVEEFGDLISKVVIEISAGSVANMDMFRKRKNILYSNNLLAIDDYSSSPETIGIVEELSPSFIKVDMSLIRNINASKEKQDVVQDIIERAHVSKIKCVAEGVETKEEAEVLLDMQIDFMQGYFIARNTAMRDILNIEAIEMIKKHSSGKV